MRKSSVYFALVIVLTLTASTAWAQTSGNVAKGFLDSFVGQTDSWWELLRGYALFLFVTTLSIEVCLMGIRMALQQKNIGEILEQFVMLLLFAFAGFIAAVIMNYQEWAKGIAIEGLKPLTKKLTGNSVDAGQPFAMAAVLLEKIVAVISGAGLRDLGHVMLYEFIILILVIVFVLISAMVIIVTCEFYIVANVGVLLIGLGGSKIFKDYAVNVMRYVLAVAIKLFVLQLIVNVGFNILSMSDVMNSAGTTIHSVKFVDMFFVIGKAIILLALAKSLPDTCAGIINGSAINGGNPLASMGKAVGSVVGTAAVGAASAGAGYALGAASATKDSFTIARAEGARGVMGTASQMARTMWNAKSDAKVGQEQKNLTDNPGSVRNQLRSKVNAIKASQILDNADSSSTPENIDNSNNPQQAINNPVYLALPIEDTKQLPSRSPLLALPSSDDSTNNSNKK